MRSAIEEVDRLQWLADDLLALARSDGGRLPLDRSRVVVAELLQRAAQRLAGSAATAGRAISVEAGPALVAHLDPMRIEDALINLIDNSLRHGGGPITVAARRDDGILSIRVSDGGPGFPEEFAANAFERFSRADTGRTGGGSGLGLAIVRAIVDAHDGHVEIEATSGEGAAVVIWLPEPK